MNHKTERIFIYALFQLLKRVGHPLESSTLYGPLHNQIAVNNYKNTIAEAVQQGGVIECGGKEIDREGFFVEPTIISNLPHDAEVIRRETFAPIVYVLKAESLDQAIEWNNEVNQGLSSALFSTNLTSVFKVSFMSFSGWPSHWAQTRQILCDFIDFILFFSGLDQMAPIAVS